MKQRITLLTVTTVWLFGAMAPAAYAKPGEHPNKASAQAKIHASENAGFNRNPVKTQSPASAKASQTKTIQATATTTAAAKSDPAGNNGTIKIDGTPFDTHPDNQPHVGCTFQVDFYNYDQGNHYADVILEAHAPTGSKQLLTDRVYIGQDSAGGGNDIDAQATYNLTGYLAGLTPHPQQGYHVKATVHADGSQGADTKHKVFWVKCAQPVGGQGGGTTVTAQPAAKMTAIPSYTGSLPRTGALMGLLLPLVGGILGATYAYLRQKYLSQNR